MTPVLFLGFPLKDVVMKQSQSAISLLELLGLIVVQGPDGEYIGKKLGVLIEREALHNAEANIYSLLNKLMSDFPFHKTPLMLFPYHE